MLQWTAAGTGRRFCLYVHHTDAKREWAYDRTAGTGRLDKGLDAGPRKGWTVVDMQTGLEAGVSFREASLTWL